MEAMHETVTGLVRTLVSEIVTKPEAVEVSGSVNEENGDLYVEVAVDESDIGKVIGRQGRIIKSIRLLARAAAAQHGFFVEVELSE